ncbi:unnamed protein product [Spirodela intermedia]|uniref:Uncharacterized protein n=1 Tax=Spirodela intermedia TaxID=51605 RepID=A0A7I8JJB1_SPIIN|nr:unnamed protein product [Spirodela intermedia]CAA6669961.1 unnamed protein product [Spirodela intermedia]
MGILLGKSAALGAWLLLLASCCHAYSPAGGVIEGTAFVDGRYAIGTTDDDFVCATLDWWPPEKCDYGWCSWGRASLLNLNLSSPMLLNAVKAFSPLKLRLGGSLQDKVVYEAGDLDQPCKPFTKNSSELFGFSQGCLPMSRWDELHDFFRETNAVVVFGLNALNGRVPMSDASLIRYTVSKGYDVSGWELGNELSGSGVGTRVGAGQYSADVVSLKRLLNEVYGASPSLEKPLWFEEIVVRTRPNLMDVITHHIYNLGPGVDEHLVSKILDPSYLEKEAATFSRLRGILRGGGSAATAWVGEAGGRGTAATISYLDQLGMAAAYDTKTYCRQTLVGGNYGLLDTDTHEPNPDYYSALLWHRLMGRTALRTNFTGTSKIRAYAHCSRQSQGITLLLINLDGNNTVRVAPTTDPDYARVARHAVGLHRMKPSRAARPLRGRKSYEFTREEYHLTAGDGDLHSRSLLLNGWRLAVDSEAHKSGPFSIVFAHIPHFYAPACRF